MRAKTKKVQGMDLETMAQHVAKVNPSASIDITLKLSKISPDSLRELTRLGIDIKHRIPELNLVIGRVTAVQYLKISSEIRRIAKVSPPAELELQQ